MRLSRFIPTLLIGTKKQNDFSGFKMAAKHDKKGRSNRTLAPFIALERYLIASPAWQSLSPVGRCAFLELLLIYNGSNNGRIALSARTLAKRLRISRATATRAIEQLEDRGFIETTRRGGFNLKTGVRRATEWRLTMYTCNIAGERPSKNFMKWQNGKIHFAASPESHNGFISEPSNEIAK
jgi:biotin operon repressor